MSFKKTLFGFIAVAVLINFAACSEQNQVRVAYHPWLGYVMPFLNEVDKNYPKISYVKTDSAPSSMELLSQNKVDAAYLTLDEAMKLKANGLDISVILVADSSAGADVVLAQPEILSKEQIIGKTVAYESNALGELMMHYFLQKYQLDKSQLNIVNMAIPDMPDMFKQHRIDIAISYFPEAWKIAKQPSNKLFSSREIPNTIVDVLAVKTSILKNDTSSACQLVDAHLEGVKRLKTNPVNSKFELANIMQLDVNEIEQNLASLGIPSKEANLQMLHDKGPLFETAKQLQTVLLLNGLFTKNIDTKSMINDVCIHKSLEF